MLLNSTFKWPRGFEYDDNGIHPIFLSLSRVTAFFTFVVLQTGSKNGSPSVTYLKTFTSCLYINFRSYLHLANMESIKDFNGISSKGSQENANHIINLFTDGGHCAKKFATRLVCGLWRSNSISSLVA